VKPLDRDFGVAGMVRTAVWLDATVGMEVLGIGRAALERADCTLEAAGTQLLMRVSLMGTWIWVSAGSLDEGEPPETICNFPDSPQGWNDVRRFVQALERSGIRALQPRPIHIGQSGSSDAYTIA
jgi:hypothetical protein